MRARREDKVISARKAAADIGFPSMRSTIGRIVKKAIELPTAEEQDEFIDEYDFPEKGNPDYVLRGMFGPEELDYFADVIKYASHSGLTVDVEDACEMLRAAIERDMRCDPSTGEPYVVSRSYVGSWMRTREDLQGLRKASPLDLKRAEKATEEVRDHWFTFLTRWCAGMYERAQDEDDEVVTSWPWQAWEDIDPRNLYNFDEESAESAKGQAKVLAAADLAHDGARRLFSIGTIDGKMPWHVTDGLTTSADGRICPPFIVHAQPQAKPKAPGATAQRMGQVTAAEAANLTDADASDGRQLSIGLGVTHSGSMIKELFAEWCDHFVSKVLLPTQGKGKEPVILFVDQHSSRMTIRALEFLLRHNVFVIFLPSHCSIWAQPNDAGVNASIKACFGRTTRRLGTAVWALKSKANFNAVYRATYIKWMDEQEAQLTAGGNAITSAWRRVGLWPLDAACAGWERALQLYGSSSMLGIAKAAAEPEALVAAEDGDDARPAAPVGLTEREKLQNVRAIAMMNMLRGLNDSGASVKLRRRNEDQAHDDDETAEDSVGAIAVCLGKGKGIRIFVLDGKGLEGCAEEAEAAEHQHEVQEDAEAEADDEAEDEAGVGIGDEAGVGIGAARGQWVLCAEDLHASGHPVVRQLCLSFVAADAASSSSGVAARRSAKEAAEQRRLQARADAERARAEFEAKLEAMRVRLSITQSDMAELRRLIATGPAPSIRPEVISAFCELTATRALEAVAKPPPGGRATRVGVPQLGFGGDCERFILSLKEKQRAMDSKRTMSIGKKMARAASKLAKDKAREKKTRAARLEALKALCDSDLEWEDAFRSLTRTKCSTLVRWYAERQGTSVDVPTQPLADHDHLVSEWNRVRPADADMYELMDHLDEAEREAEREAEAEAEEEVDEWDDDEEEEAWDGGGVEKEEEEAEEEAEEAEGEAGEEGEEEEEEGEAEGEAGEEGEEMEMDGAPEQHMVALPADMRNFSRFGRNRKKREFEDV